MSNQAEEVNVLKVEIYDTNKRMEQFRSDITMFVERIAAAVGITSEDGQLRLDTILARVESDYAESNLPEEKVVKSEAVKRKGSKK